MTERPTTAAIQFALACDPSVPGNGRLCQEITAALLGKEITRPAAAMPLQRKSWGCGVPPTSADDKRLGPKSDQWKRKVAAT